MRAVLPVVVAVALGAVALSAGSSSEAGASPTVGSCQVFPDPPASLPANAPSLDTEAAWNQDISKAPRDPRSAAYISYINSQGDDFLHPDFGSFRGYGIPYTVVGAGQRKLPVNYTAYGDESDRGPFPVPGKAPVEGGRDSDGDRHVLVLDSAACKLYELYRAFFVAKPRPHWNADAGVAWDLTPPHCAPTAGPPPTPPDCRSSPASSATTRSPPADSTTRSGSPSRAPATPGSTPLPTAPATPPAVTRRRWAYACG